jgi:Zn-dependent metalloprotease
VRNITDHQKELLDQLLGAWPNAEVTWDDARGVVARARFAAGGDDQAPSEDELLDTYGPLFGPERLKERLREMRPLDDDLGMDHRRYWQAVAVKGVEPVELYGSRLLVHLREGSVVEVQSGLWRDAEVESPPVVKATELREILQRRLGQARGTSALVKSLPKKDQRTFPLATTPRLVVFAWRGDFRLSWTAIAWGAFEKDRDRDAEGSSSELDVGPAFVDAVTSEVFFHSPGGRNAENATTGSGTRCTPLTGGFGSRTLNIVRIDSTSTYRLKDTTRARTVVTYDAAGTASYGSDTTLGSAIVGSTLAVSEDTDGDFAWTRVPANTTAAERTASQQSEVDLHWFTGDIYDWYAAIGSRVGWDNNDFSSPPVPAQTLHAVAHVPGGINAGMRSTWSGGNVTYWLKFFDGDVTTYDYLAGSAFIVAHEYQHAVTEFSFEDAAGNPGVTYDSGWMGAMHEGVSDVFGTLYEANWTMAADISPSNQIFRNIVFPRDDGPPPSTASWDANHLDHWADRTIDTERYSRGTILAHCAYLMGSGGVHHRAARTPVLIPVYSLGTETVSGRSVLKAARIWYRAMRFYFGTVAAPTADPSSDQNLFTNLRTACISAANDLYPGDTREVKNTTLAFYAVGMHPAGTSYGADCTFLRWRADWDRSSPYIGITSPMWASVDLFVNNGGTSDWNAQVNSSTSDFENQVYCRVRNVGDLPATGVTVAFHYAKIGSAPTGWLPMVDKNGVTQTLTIGTLATGSSTFPDSQQNSPPAAAGVKWFIPPIPAGETVDHYCIRAVVSATNDVNNYNNDVQSNIAYSLFSGITSGIVDLDFLMGNPTRKTIPADALVVPHLPDGWSVKLEGLDRRRRLKPQEELVVHVKVAAPRGGALPLTAPFDGRVDGEVRGCWAGALRGHLSGASEDPAQLAGRLSAIVADLGELTGAFEGQLDPDSGRLRGTWSTTGGCGKNTTPMCLLVAAVLHPDRSVDIAQRIGGEAVGGVTLWIQVPLPDDDVAMLKKQTATVARRKR